MAMMSFRFSHPVSDISESWGTVLVTVFPQLSNHNPCNIKGFSKMVTQVTLLLTSMEINEKYRIRKIVDMEV
jgi:hypothetical protein